jgi:hypothetical protein
MKTVHTTQENIVKMIKAFNKTHNANPLSRKTCTIVAMKKGTNDTTIQTIKRAPYRVTDNLQNAKKKTPGHLIPFYNPKAVNLKTQEVGAYRCVVGQNIISAEIDGVMYVAQQANAL